MKRVRVYLTALAGFGGMLLLAGLSQAQQPGGAPGSPPAQPNQPSQPAVRPTIAVFNMAAVMRDYGKAKYQVYVLNEKRKGMSKEITEWRAEYVKIQQEIQNQQVPSEKEKLAKRMLDLSRLIQDKDTEISKVLNEEASRIISSLYDEIKLVVDKTAEMNGYHIVFAYPDAVTAEELKSPVYKELKLKPPAAHPFFIAKQVDLTGVVIQTLNNWYPAPPVPQEAAKDHHPATPSTQPPPTPPGAGGPVPGGPPGRP